MTRAMLQQLYGLRLIIDGLIGAAEVELAVAEGEPPEETLAEGACPHPKERQLDATVMGEPPMVICLDCGQQRAGVIAPQ